MNNLKSSSTVQIHKILHIYYVLNHKVIQWNIQLQKILIKQSFANEFKREFLLTG